MNKSEIPHLLRGDQNPPEKLIVREPLVIDDFKRIIRDMGLKVTKQRMGILKSLNQGRVHVTAQEVFEEVSQEYPDMGFATVYRFLRKLTEKNFVTEVRLGGQAARYELTPKQHHDHITCVRCGRIVEFQNLEIEQLQEEVAVENGFRLTHHVLELYGICGDPNCHQTN